MGLEYMITAHERYNYKAHELSPLIIGGYFRYFKGNCNLKRKHINQLCIVDSKAANESSFDLVWPCDKHLYYVSHMAGVWAIISYVLEGLLTKIVMFRKHNKVVWLAWHICCTWHRCNIMPSAKCMFYNMFWIASKRYLFQPMKG